ncbi:MAG TPA: hypothetical protein VII56_07515 [Rhizomicrobium sp.]
MLKALLHGQIRKFERLFGYDGTYMHEVADASTSAGWKFALGTWVSQHRQGVPKEAWYAAKLAAALAEDCGPCTQLAVDMAVKGGVEPEKMAALIRGDIEAAGDDAALGYRYGIAVATNSDAVLELVEEARTRYGEKGLVSLALVVAFTRVFPATKRGLGHGAACAKIDVANQSIAVQRAA